MTLPIDHESTLHPFPGITFTSTDHPIFDHAHKKFIPPLPNQRPGLHEAWVTALPSLVSALVEYDQTGVLPSGFGLVADLKKPNSSSLPATTLTLEDILIFELNPEPETRHSIGYVISGTHPKPGIETLTPESEIVYPHGFIFSYETPLNGNTFRFAAIPTIIESPTLNLGRFFHPQTDIHTFGPLLLRYSSIPPEAFASLHTIRLLHLRRNWGEPQPEPQPVDVTADSLPLKS